MGMGEEVGPMGGWRRLLRRELSLLLCFKFAALLLLWWLFFSPTHRPAVDGVSAGHRLALEQAMKSAPAVPPAGEHLD